MLDERIKDTLKKCNKHGWYKEDICPGCLRDAAPALLDACKFAANPKAPFKTDQLAFANNIIAAIAKKAKAAIAKIEKK